MSARQQGNITDRCLKAAEEESRNPRGARIPKRRRDDDVTFTQSQFSRVPPTKYNRSTLFDDMQEETFQFDIRQRLTERKCLIQAFLSFTESLTLRFGFPKQQSQPLTTDSAPLIIQRQWIRIIFH
jgi:hypothetical protein